MTSHFILLVHPASKACHQVVGAIAADIPRLSVDHPLAQRLFPHVTAIPTLVRYEIIEPQELFASMTAAPPPPEHGTTLLDDIPQMHTPVDGAPYKLKEKNTADLAGELKRQRDELIPDVDERSKRIGSPFPDKMVA